MPRALLLAILLVASTASAESSYTVGASLMMKASQSGSLSEGGAGPAFELARTYGRYQLFGELGVAAIGVSTHSGAGGSARAGLGARWFARTFRADEAEIQLVFEGVLGAEYLTWWSGYVARPDASVGIGWQVRARRSEGSPFAIRFMTRLVYTPPHDDATPMERSNYGFLGVFGVSW